MELQDRSRSYPNLPSNQGNLVMGPDGRLQYAPISAPQGSGSSYTPPSIPQPIESSIMYQPSINLLTPETMDAQACCD